MESRRDRDKKGTAHTSTDLAEERKLWAVLRSSENHVLRAELLADLTARFVSSLPATPAQSSFRRLCKLGCNDTALAVVLFGMQQQPRNVEALLISCLGSQRQRQSRARLLDKAAEALEDVWLRTVLTLVVQAIPHEERQGRNEIEVDEQSVRTVSDSLASNISSTGYLPPMHLAKDLRFFARLNSMLSRLKGNELSDVLKYCLSAYVKRSTDGFRDAEVAALIAAAAPSSSGYNLRAHIMWRRRNYERLEMLWAIVPALLLASHQPTM